MFQAHRLIYGMCRYAHIHPYTCIYIQLFGNHEISKSTPSPTRWMHKSLEGFLWGQNFVFCEKNNNFKKNPPPITPTKTDSDLAEFFLEVKLLVWNLPPYRISFGGGNRGRDFFCLNSWNHPWKSKSFPDFYAFDNEVTKPWKFCESFPL